MTNQELEALLSRKTRPAANANLSLTLAAQTARTAARLKKRRRDRRQLLLCCAAVIAFIAAAAGLMLALNYAESPEIILRPAGYAALGGMSLTLIMAPVLAWSADEERKGEG